MICLPDGSRRYSPSDLIAYLEGDFAAWCERLDAERRRGADTPDTLAWTGLSLEPDEADEERALAARKGEEHEARYLVSVRARHPALVEIRRDESAGGATLAAMRACAPAIYQGWLTQGAWQGYPDFLFPVEGDSALGGFHYEPWDTKLARSAKPYFIVQLCAYADLLEAVQGGRPSSIHFVLGNDEERSFPTDQYFFYYLRLKQSFLAFQDSWKSGDMPDPGLDRTHGRWGDLAARILETSDHLSRVAGITRGQIRRLEDADIATLSALASTTVARVPRMGGQAFERFRLQAKLQVASKGAARPAYEIRLPPAEEPRRGLALLPPPSRSDVFFDMEGFPFATDGLEYLFGVVWLGDARPEFQDWWAHNQAEEKKAFEGFIDWVYARWQQDPTMHIYHYAAYERSALCRLMGKYATREAQVDDLLRHDVLVDLFTVVRQGVAVGTPSYSLKDIERLYMPPRTEGITSAAGSVVEYQRWLDSGEPPRWQESPILKGIRTYNHVDCDSTRQLRDWLLERRGESKVQYLPPESAVDPAATAASSTPSPAESLAAHLLRQAEAEPDAERRRVTELLGWLVEFHRREEKPMWWRMFDRLDMTEEELRDDMDCLAGLVRTSTPPRAVKKSFALEFSYDPDQDTKLHEGSKCLVAGGHKGRYEIVSMDQDVGRLELKVGPRGSLPDRLSLIPDEFVNAEVIKEAVFRFASEWSQGRVLSQAVQDLLFRRPPRIRGHVGGPLIAATGQFLPQVIDLATRLDATTLCIQGPPGTGKTFTAAAIIVDLLRQGKRVGIAANSHKVILNLMGAIAKARNASGVRGVLYKVGDEADDPLITGGDVLHLEGSADAAGVIGNDPVVVGGTAWVFSRPELQGRFDYLFIDEAGQTSLANAVAMGLSATNVILVGDQMQLSQPMQGTHPGETGLSCLEYALHGRATIPPDHGIFLDTSFRMHPAVCGFISDAIYEGRLRSDPATAKQRILTSAGALVPKEAGIVFLPVEHEGCAQSSDEEVSAIEGLVSELIAGQFVDKTGNRRSMTLDDVLLVAPFNMQVRQLRDRLGSAARVGSVDKFQGQEAPVVIVSMCASSLEEAPRGAEFLLSPNRLNVAVSRAQALAIIVGSPGLMTTRCRTIDEMRLVNLLCRLCHYADQTNAPKGRAA